MKTNYWIDLCQNLVTDVFAYATNTGLISANRKVLKSSPNELLTKTDLEIKNYVIKWLKKANAPVRHFSEELRDGYVDITSKPVVSTVLDELDGTANFLRHIPWYGTTIAVIENLDKFDTDNIIASATVQYPNGDVFYAGKGLGTYLNGERCHTSKRKSLDDMQSMIILESKMDADNFSEYLPLFRYKGYIRDFGASSVDWAYVASGRAELRKVRNQKINDMAAGVLLVREAGGLVTDFSGNRLRVERDIHTLNEKDAVTPAIAAANESILKQSI